MYDAQRFSRVVMLWLIAVIAVIGITVGAVGPSRAADCSVDQGGKYVHKIYTLLVPGDVKKYGDCHDYGYWKGGSYANHTGIPPGYWVYAKPYWYVYAEKAKTRQQGKDNGCSPSQGEKYADLAHKLYLPTDEKKYTGCYDYGWWGNSSYAGYNNLTPGYWVYAYPHWYVWQKKR